MKKIIDRRFDFSTGQIVEEESKIKIKNFDDGEAGIYYREFLISKGYKDNLSVTKVFKGKWGELQYPTLFGFPLKVRFCLWHAQKDSDTGKAVLWVGEKNSKKLTQEQVDYGVVVEDRIVRNDISYYALIVTTRTFRVGNSLKNQPFVDYLLVPIEDIIATVKDSKKAWIDLRKSDREKYSFDKIIGRLIDASNRSLE